MSGDTEAAGETSDEGESADVDETEELLDNAEELVIRAVRLSEELLGDASQAEADTAERLDELRAVADEAAELLESMDLSELPSAIDEEELDEVVDEGDIPEAIANRDPQEAIRLRKLLAVVDLAELWGSVDVREVWRNKRELEDAVDDFTDDDDDGMFSSDEDDDGGMFSSDEDGEMVSTDRNDIDVPDAAYQTAIQSQLADSVDVFRAGLIEVHEELEEMRKANQERIDETDQPESRNPTATSTLATTRTDHPVITQYSTVPQETKHSSAPNRPRIYGSRFEKSEEDDA